jgi:hypothetical protein
MLTVFNPEDEGMFLQNVGNDLLYCMVSHCTTVYIFTIVRVSSQWWLCCVFQHPDHVLQAAAQPGGVHQGPQ